LRGPSRPRPLGSTYRLQLNGLGFVGAQGLVGYLSALGIETLYASPVLAAVPGSTHGYDVVDPTRLDPDLGTPDDFEALLAELAAYGMRLLVDIVPNHMATHPANRWWWDTLGHGRSARSAEFFDIDWDRHAGKVLLSTLSVPLRELIDARPTGVAVDRDRLELSVGTQRYPLDPASVTGDPALERAEDVLARQHYRLAFWRLGPVEGNYRRFFDIDGLVGLRMEDRNVYEDTHRYLLALAADERVAGLRVDHVDGLSDPAGYLARLRADLDAGRSEPASVVIEKILGPGEALPPDWPVEGTTGYEFANLATGLFVDRVGAAAIESFGRRFSGQDLDFDQVELEAKRTVLAELFPGQLDRLTTLARRALEALVALLVGQPSGVGVGPGDPVEARVELALRFQQLTGAVAAKGTEDTACYRFAGLLCGAEVGGSPGAPAVQADQFHRALESRQSRNPGALNAGSTHDTKRSADVRARLAVLSEIPEEWERLVTRWHRRYRDSIEAAGGPDPIDELFCYQSLVGVWPVEGGRPPDDLRGRVQVATRKAAREAKRSTSWTDPDQRYEQALAAFVDRLFADDPLVAELGRLLRRIGPAGATNSLAMVTLGVTAPGVPDIYQGTELWQFSLMDPDNRRPVDFEERARALRSLAELAPSGQLDAAGARKLITDWKDGRVKLHVTTALLGLRRASPSLFSSGLYLPLETSGPQRDRVVAFARRHREAWAVAIVPRRVLASTGPGRFPLGASVWGSTSIKLPDEAPVGYFDALTGAPVSAWRGRLKVAEILGALPVSVLRAGQLTKG
jgi:(1->4)-alpha-D-glucan 1-alpha-D-glucosylmutase